MLYLQQILHNCHVFRTAFAEQHECCGSEEENVARFNTRECVGRVYSKPEQQYQEICR